MRAFLVLVAGAAAALALGACGGDATPEQQIDLQTETTASAELSKADFIDEADARCAEANTAIETMVENGEGFTGSGEIADLRQVVLEELKELGPPSEDRATLDQFLTALEQQVEAGKKIALAIERDEDTTQFESELEDARADAETAASEYGFKECGSPVTATDTGTGTGAGTSDSTGVVPVTPAPAPAPAPAPDSGGTGDTGGGGTGGGGVGIP
jgi:hypothetical protein